MPAEGPVVIWDSQVTDLRGTNQDKTKLTHGVQRELIPLIQVKVLGLCLKLSYEERARQSAVHENIEHNGKCMAGRMKK